MQVCHDKTEGPSVIAEDLTHHGMITVAATLRGGCTLILHGMITGDLDVEPNARAIIHGMVNGAIRNSGYVELYGTADEVITLTGDAQTSIAPGAVIKGQY